MRQHYPRTILLPNVLVHNRINKLPWHKKQRISCEIVRPAPNVSQLDDLGAHGMNGLVYKGTAHVEEAGAHTTPASGGSHAACRGQVTNSACACFLARRQRGPRSTPIHHIATHDTYTSVVWSQRLHVRLEPFGRASGRPRNLSIVRCAR